MLRAYVCSEFEETVGKVLYLRGVERAGHHEQTVHAVLATPDEGGGSTFRWEPVMRTQGFVCSPEQPFISSPFLDFYLRNEWERKGIGGLIMSVMLTWLRRYHADRELGECSLGQDSPAFYKRFGFSVGKRGDLPFTLPIAVRALQFETLRKHWVAAPKWDSAITVEAFAAADPRLTATYKQEVVPYACDVVERQ